MRLHNVYEYDSQLIIIIKKKKLKEFWNLLCSGFVDDVGPLRRIEKFSSKQRTEFVIREVGLIVFPHKFFDSDRFFT